MGLLIGLTAGTCERAETADPGAAVVRDSLGVTIVDNRSPAWGDASEWTIDPEPLLTIGAGGAAAAHPLFRVVSVMRLRDGTVVVADGGSGTLRWFDGEGIQLVASGGSGDGPGEFRNLSWIGLVAEDSVIAWDWAGRMSVFVHGVLARDFRVDPVQPWGPLTVLGNLRDGRIVALPVPFSGAETRPGVHRPEVPVWIVSRTGEVEAEVGAFPSAAVEYTPAATPGALLRRLIPFGPSSVITASGTRIVVGDNAEYALRMYDERGTLLHVARVPGTPDPVRPEELERELERRLEAAPPIEEVRAGIRAAFEATPAPNTKPFFDRLVIDSEGYTWVRREAGSSRSGGRWDIIAPDGRWMGILRTPPALEITQVGSDFIIGIRTAEDGVEDVRVFRLSRSSPH